jgi:uncharacterized protein YndB with AHSA1/START domain
LCIDKPRIAYSSWPWRMAAEGPDTGRGANSGTSRPAEPPEIVVITEGNQDAVANFRSHFIKKSRRHAVTWAPLPSS